MATKEDRQYLDDRILTGGRELHRNRRSEARRTSGGRTEYLPETYTTAQAVALVMEA